jgi:hypothetical protein
VNGMKANPRVTLDVGVNMERFKAVGPTHVLHQIDHRLEQAIGRPSDSGGCGFGVRDGQWEFDTQEEADAALIRVGKAFRESELDYANTYEMDEDDDV